jgi:hypothetical protein
MATIPYQMMIEIKTGKVLAAGYTDLQLNSTWDKATMEIIVTKDAAKIPALLPVDEAYFDAEKNVWEVTSSDTGVKETGTIEGTAKVP